jgi:uncharacterized protein YhbP (UPF0306 family)
MNQEVLDYLATQMVCAFSVEMPDGSPHAATVHFAHSTEPLMFFFETDRNYRKSEALLNKEITRSCLVVGVDATNKKTFQADGEARLLRPDEQELFAKIYLGKFPNKQKKTVDPNSLFFVFIPKWWRFTDYTKPTGKVIFSSEQEVA